MVTIPILKKIVEIPDGVSVDIGKDNNITVKASKNTLERRLFYPGVKIYLEGKTVVIQADFPRREQKGIVGTYRGHISNMITGVTDGFEYKMKAVNAHFPMTIKVEGNQVRVDNFLGEKIPRKCNIVGKTKVKVSMPEVIINGIDKEDVGQTAANIELLTKVKNRDRRVFQDGIYLIEKNGAKI